MKTLIFIWKYHRSVAFLYSRTRGTCPNARESVASAFLISMWGNGILQAFACYGERVARLVADIGRGGAGKELERPRCCESARGVLVYQSVHAFLLLFF